MSKVLHPTRHFRDLLNFFPANDLAWDWRNNLTHH